MTPIFFCFAMNCQLSSHYYVDVFFLFLCKRDSNRKNDSHMWSFLQHLYTCHARITFSIIEWTTFTFKQEHNLWSEYILNGIEWNKQKPICYAKCIRFSIQQVNEPMWYEWTTATQSKVLCKAYIITKMRALQTIALILIQSDFFFFGIPQRWVR